MNIPFVTFLPMERELEADLRGAFDRVFKRSWYIEGVEDSDFEKFLPDYKNLDEMKAHYIKGGLGDGTCKKFLLNVLNDRLEPIRQRRKEYEKDIPGVYEILRRGTEEARKVGAQTLAEVRHAMRIDYFDDKELIAEQAKRFAQQ